MRTRLPERNLDVLRAVAVLLVVGFHVSMTAGLKWPLAASLARAGVIFFFVHTSLVLMSSLERGGEGPGWVRALYVRRAFRIYPLAIAAVVVVALLGISPRVPVAGVVFPFDAPSVRELAANVTLTQNVFGIRDLWGVLWSLPIEVQMYALLPACYLVARASTLWTVGLVALAMLGGALFAADAFPGLWRLNLLAFGPCFTAGVLAFSLMRHRRNAPPLPSALLFAALALALTSIKLNPMQGVAAPIVAGWLIALPIAVALPFLRELPDSALTRCAKVLAKYSYGIYLAHNLAAWLAFVVLRHSADPMRVVVYAVAMVGLPWAAFHLIESPLIDLGRRLVHTGGPAAAAIVPAP